MTGALAWIGVALLSVGAAAVALSLALPGAGTPREALERRARLLDRELRFIRADISGRTVVIAQVLAVTLSPVAAWILYEPLLLAIVPAALLLPNVLIERERTQRVARIEEELDSWLLGLANALRSTASLGDALRSSVEIAGGAMGEEIDTAVKSMRLGLSVDHALIETGERIRSVMVSSALGALVVGRATGGNLPALVEKTASSLREMRRLEGNLRAQTSGARAQATVMMSLPFVIVGLLQYLDPTWFSPLADEPMGMVISTAAVALWVAAVLITRATLAVDL